MLSDALFMYNDAMARKIDLLKLRELFSRYTSDKGLKQSLMKVEELYNLIANDIRKNNDSLEEINNLIRGLKEIQNQMIEETLM